MNERQPNAKTPAKPRRNRTGKRTPFRAPDRTRAVPSAPPTSSPSQVADMRRLGGETKTGQFAEQLQAGVKEIKRERLHKVLAQSGHGSRRDMEILIASGRVLVNGIVASAGVQVGPGDVVLVDHRHVKLSYSPEFPRVLLYHKPEGEIVTTSDPGNRITVFDNLPRVENGKWLAIGRLDFNTSGLLIFTTNGELANRMTHPRFEIEREYAVRILGELTEEQKHSLLAGINIDDNIGNGADVDDDDRDADSHQQHDSYQEHADADVDIIDGEEGNGNGNIQSHEDTGSALARFASIEARGGEGANHWYHVVIKEGRNREVRRMFETLGLTVSRLMRVRFGKVELPPRLLRGKILELDPQQVKDLLVWAGVPIEGMELPRATQKPGGPQRERERERESKNASGRRRQAKADGQVKVGRQKSGHTPQAQRTSQTANGAERPPRGNQAERPPRSDQTGRPPRGDQAGRPPRGEQASRPPREAAQVNAPATEDGAKQNQRRNRSRRSRPRRPPQEG